MPVIELQKKRTNKDRGYKPLPDTPNEWCQEIYASALWRRLRRSYLMSHPLCEIHLLNDGVKSSEDVHHIHPVSDAATKLEAYDIAYDSRNLMALCHECHQRYHAINHSRHAISKDDLKFLNKYKELCNKKNGN